MPGLARWGTIVALLLAIAGPPPAAAQSDASLAESAILRIPEGASLPVSRRIRMGLNKAMIIELPTDAQDAIVSQPNTADVTVLTARRVLVYAKAAGEASVFLLGRDGRKLLIMDLSVRRDFSDLSIMLHKLLPGARLKVAASGEGVVLSGTVVKGPDAARAEEIATQYVNKAPVVNLITTGARDQVLLKVTVAELQREAVRRLGINLPETIAKAGTVTFTQIMQNAFPPSATIGAVGTFVGPGRVPLVGVGTVAQATTSWNGNRITTMLEAFERVGLSKTLAEPTLIAISGEPAKFHAGGEFPVPLSATNNTVSVSWKSFGVSVGFTPFVLSEGRISLKVSAEVSELSTQGAVTLQSISIPAVQTRRAETTVEMPSGSALAMAGLLSDSTRQNVDGIPELKNVPVLGALFRSKDFKNSQSELVILVTPYVVRPTDPSELSRPDEGMAPATALQGLLRGHLHRVYTNLPEGGLKGDYGFIVEHPEHRGGKD